MNLIDKYLKEVNPNNEDTYIVRKTKKGSYVDQAFNNVKDAQRFSKLVKGKIFTIKGNNITPYTF